MYSKKNPEKLSKINVKQPCLSGWIYTSTFKDFGAKRKH